MSERDRQQTPEGRTPRQADHGREDAGNGEEEVILLEDLAPKADVKGGGRVFGEDVPRRER
ncbi:MAG TPA: hypothetical protein VMM18_10720 [Gemmatimonadaceae bacterium]|nr:hypothetical protein [Gemmatimonadaceae bacterium]